jgi:putative transposase
MAEASERVPLPLIGACLMPNHAHLIVCPTRDNDLARWMHWLFATYSRRYHKKYGTTGRLWENRYRAFAIQGDTHLLIALRYVERNALSANLSCRAEQWEWGSLNWRTRSHTPVALDSSLVSLPSDWRKVVNTAQTEKELAALRNCVNRQCPFGTEEWVAQTAAELGMSQSLSPLGRPKRRSPVKK